MLRSMTDWCIHAMKGSDIYAISVTFVDCCVKRDVILLHLLLWSLLFV